MAVQKPFLLYLRSRLNVTVIVVSLAALAAGLALFRGNALPVLGAVAALYAAATALLFLSRRGAGAVVAEADRDRAAADRRKIDEAAAVRQRISVLRLGDEDLRLAVENFLLVSGQYLEKARAAGAWSPQGPRADPAGARDLPGVARRAGRELHREALRHVPTATRTRTCTAARSRPSASALRPSQGHPQRPRRPRRHARDSASSRKWKASDEPSDRGCDRGAPRASRRRRGGLRRERPACRSSTTWWCARTARPRCTRAWRGPRRAACTASTSRAWPAPPCSTPTSASPTWRAEQRSALSITKTDPDTWDIVLAGGRSFGGSAMYFLNYGVRSRLGRVHRLHHLARPRTPVLLRLGPRAVGRGPGAPDRQGGAARARGLGDGRARPT